MDPNWAVAVVSVLTIAGQAFNVVLNLRTNNAILRSERRTLDRVQKEHPTKEVFNLRVSDHDRRLRALEGRNV